MAAAADMVTSKTAVVMIMTRTAADTMTETRCLLMIVARMISMSLHSPERFLLMTIVTMTALLILLLMQQNVLRRFLFQLVQIKIT